MMLESFFEKFDLFADAPNAVVKMRELVLELAVKGKLVPQNSDDGAATDLLKRLIEFKIANPLSGRSGRSKENPSNDNESTATQAERVPENWVSTTVGEILYVIRGASPRPKGDPQYFSSTRTPYHWVKISDIRKHGRDGLLMDTDEFLTKRGMEKSVLLPKGTLVLTNSATIGVPIVLGVDGCCIHDGYLAFPNFPHALLSQKFFLYLFQTLKKHAEQNARGLAQLNLNTELVRSFPFMLPPLAEQKRIVARVEELIVLCDRLEAQQNEREKRHFALRRAAIGRFEEAPTPANLDVLFHQSFSVAPDDLRKVILNQAVQGKLVPQDSDEETAQSALARLGLRAADDPNDGSASEGTSLPESWRCVRFEEIAAITGGVTLGRKLTGRKTVTLPYLRVANVKRGDIDVSVMKEIEIAEDEVERYALADGDLLLTEGGDWDKVGRAAMWDGRISPCLHQNHIFRARMRSPELSPFWIERYLNSPCGRAYFESAAKQTTNLASINMRQVRACPVNFPPIEEQKRILRKLKQLMALVDQLDSALQTSAETAQKLLDAVIHELLNPAVTAIEFPASARDCTSDRAAIGCYTIQRLEGNRSFGHTMNMKVVYLSQAHLGLPLDLRFERRAAGPWHPWIEEFDALGQNEGWFTITQKPIGEDRTKYEYAPKPALKHKAAEAVAVLGEHKAEFDRLLNLFADLNTEQAEIIATLFAAWNDFLIDGKSPTDDEIIHEVRENWHESKRRFTPALLKDRLRWMRKHRLVPQGRGSRTQQQLLLTLN